MNGSRWQQRNASRTWVGLALVVAFAAACSDDGGPPGSSPDGGVDGAQSCAGQADGTACGIDKICLAEACVDTACGDGFVDPGAGEACDDGNATPDDGCEPDCSFTCETATDCDDGDPCNGEETCEVSSHTCAAGTALTDGTSCGTDASCLGGACTPASCGNSMVDPGEQCDDGQNGDATDGCTDNCTFTCEIDADCTDGDCRNGVEVCDTSAHICVTSGCDDGDPCTLNQCNQSDGKCEFPLDDADGDHYAGATCTTPGLMGGDCNDNDMNIHPGATEVCNVPLGYTMEVDDDCNGLDGFDELVTNAYFRDRDGDGYGDETVGLPCPMPGFVMNADDCFDGADPSSVGSDVHPGHNSYEPNPYCKDGDAVQAMDGSWSCTTTAAVPSWDWNCDRNETPLWTDTGGGCYCQSGTRIGCDTSCTPPSWSGDTVPDCGVTASWQGCTLDLMAMFCTPSLTTRTQECR